MIKFNTLGDAIRLAEAAHFTQVDKAGLPYIEHPRRVLEKVKAQGALPYVQMAAILHDVTEDTKYTPEVLEILGFPESAVEIVRLLDRGYSENLWKEARARYITTQSPDEYYYTRIRDNRGALMVKLADIEDNLSEWRLSYLSEETQTRLRKKYADAKAILQPSLIPSTDWTNTSKTIWS